MSPAKQYKMAMRKRKIIIHTTICMKVEGPVTKKFRLNFRTEFQISNTKFKQTAAEELDQLL